jgi:hypothetical protein
MGASSVLMVALVLASVASGACAGERSSAVLDLSGRWEVAEGSMDAVPQAESFTRTVVVPGLIDMAAPGFEEVGVASKRREAFWYRRTFTLDGAVPASAKLKIHKAKYGTKVVLNGQVVGEHWPNFTPGLFDVREYLKGEGQENELLVRVGASVDVLPEWVPWGHDYEKTIYIPGIYDAVELICAGPVAIENVQVAAEVEKQSVRVVVEVENATGEEVAVTCVVREAASGKEVGRAEVSDDGGEGKIDVRIGIEGCRLWSPEDPFLYELEVSTGSDVKRVRFGMRELKFNAATGLAELNGEPYYLRGTNVCIFRFFEDPNRGDLPWDEQWVRTLMRRMKSMHWNIFRTSLGFVPEFWYDLADEEGLMIQDEYPFWYGKSLPAGYTVDQIATEYEEWMRERWNHPSVVIWDAANETYDPRTGEAVARVRALDLSDRPWENGWSAPMRESDPLEEHPYFFATSETFRFSHIADKERKAFSFLIPGIPVVDAPVQLINEYGFLWLNRDGSPTRMTRLLYALILDGDATADERRELAARYLAALTELWRTSRVASGVMHFCALGGYVPYRGATCDNFVDIEKLEFEPYFEEYVGDAFKPVGLMVDYWKEHWFEEELPAEPIEVPVAVINDLKQPWVGQVRFGLRAMEGGAVLMDEVRRCEVEGLGRTELRFKVAIPQEAGKYRMVAQLEREGDEAVRSLREFEVKPEFTPGVFVNYGTPVWSTDEIPDEPLTIGLWVGNDMNRTWRGEAQVTLTSGERVLYDERFACEVGAFSNHQDVKFPLTIPSEVGVYTLRAQMIDEDGKLGKSDSYEFKVVGGEGEAGK